MMYKFRFHQTHLHQFLIVTRYFRSLLVDHRSEYLHLDVFKFKNFVALRGSSWSMRSQSFVALMTQHDHRRASLLQGLVRCLAAPGGLLTNYKNAWATFDLAHLFDLLAFKAKAVVAFATRDFRTQRVACLCSWFCYYPSASVDSFTL